MIKKFNKYFENQSQDDILNFEVEIESINNEFGKFKGIDIVWQSNNVYVIKIKSYESCQRICRSTRWCIAYSEKNWNEYIKDACQYAIFDFNLSEENELSIVGITVKRNEILYPVTKFNTSFAYNSFDWGKLGILKQINIEDFEKFLKTKKIPFDIFDTNIVEAEKTKEERKSWNEKKWKRHLRSK